MAMNDNQAPESRETAESQQAAFYGRSGGNLDLEARLAIEGHRPLGLTILDPKTGERVSL